MEVHSLLQICFSHVSDISYESVYKKNIYGKESVERYIYDKMVEKARIKIRRALRKNKSEMILKSIYLVRKESITGLNQHMLGFYLHQYNKSLFRLAVVFAVGSFCSVTQDNYNNGVILDIIDFSEMVLPEYASEREFIIKYLRLIKEQKEDLDIMTIVNCYLAFGEYLHPYI